MSNRFLVFPSNCLSICVILQWLYIDICLGHCWQRLKIIVFCFRLFFFSYNSNCLSIYLSVSCLFIFNWIYLLIIIYLLFYFIFYFHLCLCVTFWNNFQALIINFIVFWLFFFMLVCGVFESVVCFVWSEEIVNLWVCSRKLLNFLKNF